MYIILSASSCENDDDGPIVPTPDTVLPSKIYIDGELAAEFTYNDINKVVSIKYLGDDNDEVLYEYDGSGNLSKENVKDGGQDYARLYEYNSENLATKIITTGHEFYEGYQELSYNPDKTLKEVNIFSENSSGAKEVFTYDNSGNAVGYKRHNTSQGLIEHSVIAYDDKNNPFYGLLPYHYYSELFLYLLSPNNITEIEDMEDSYTTSYEYKYNDAGYPTEVIISYSDDGDDGYTETWKLEYK